jgi:hypothetical protein
MVGEVSGPAVAVKATTLAASGVLDFDGVKERATRISFATKTSIKILHCSDMKMVLTKHFLQECVVRWHYSVVEHLVRKASEVQRVFFYGHTFVDTNDIFGINNFHSIA